MLCHDLVAAIKELDSANEYPDGIEGMDLAIHARDKQLAAQLLGISARTIYRKLAGEEAEA